MRWTVIISLTALIVKITAQKSTIDIINPSVNQTNNRQNNTHFADEEVINYNSSYNSTININNSKEETDGVLVNVPNLSVTEPNSRDTNDTSEDKSDELIQSSENYSIGKPISEETAAVTTDKPTPDSPSQNQSSNQEITNVISTSEESNSSQQSENEELLSIENKDSNESSIGTIVTSRSAESSVPNSEPDVNELENLIETGHGSVRGHIWRDTSEIIAYIDIPYGTFKEPFEAPNKVQSWDGVLENKEHSKSCPHYENQNYVGSTDCLTLSIFTPKSPENVSVLFYIHDGYSTSKSADPLIYGPEYLVPKGVILVLPNYRLGPMGFLCLQNETAPGNAGLKDLTLALEWVKEKIHLFGGNASNIVVSGDGGAGAYAGYLALCSQSSRYVNRVITESGSALSHWALDRDPIGKANELAEIIRRKYSDGVLYNNTFGEVDLTTVINAAQDMRLNPCIEGDKAAFLGVTPWKLLQDKEIDTTFMIGAASYAGAHEAVTTSAATIEQLNANFGQFLPDDLQFKNDAERNQIAQQLREQYFKDGNITSDHMKELSLWYTDASYMSPVVRLARPLIRAGATVYLYEFAFVGRLNREFVAMDNVVQGAVRGDIVGYLFRKNGTSAEDELQEKPMIDLMVHLWITFINTGMPEAENVTWSEFTKAEDSDEKWLLINSEPEAKKGIHLDRLRLWTSLYEQHFIDNSAFGPRPYPYLALIMTLLWRVANYSLKI